MKSLSYDDTSTQYCFNFDPVAVKSTFAAVFEHLQTYLHAVLCHFFRSPANAEGNHELLLGLFHTFYFSIMITYLKTAWAIQKVLCP